MGGVSGGVHAEVMSGIELAEQDIADVEFNADGNIAEGATGQHVSTVMMGRVRGPGALRDGGEGYRRTRPSMSKCCAAASAGRVMSGGLVGDVEMAWRAAGSGKHGQRQTRGAETAYEERNALDDSEARSCALPARAQLLLWACSVSHRAFGRSGPVKDKLCSRRVKGKSSRFMRCHWLRKGTNLAAVDLRSDLVL